MQARTAVKMLALAVRASYQPAARASLLSASHEIPWSSLPALAIRHRVEGLAWDGLLQAGIDGPDEAQAALAEGARIVAARHLDALAASSALAERFSRAGVDMLFLKGIPLGFLAYPRPQAKDSCDIDLWVPQTSLGEACRLLDELGYRPVVPGSLNKVAPWHHHYKESVWIEPQSGRQIDLHSRLADNPALLHEIDANPVREWVDCDAVTLPTLSDAQLYAYLCVHGASSAWFRLKWLADLHAFILARGPERVGDWHHLAMAEGVGRASALAQSMLRQWFDLPLQNWTPASPAQRILNHISVRQLVSQREPTQRILGTFGIHLTQMLQRPGVAFFMHELYRQAMDVAKRG